MCPDASSAAEHDVFGLDGQIEHKLAFLRRHVPRDTRLVLLGHSIGCYIILDMMKRNPELNVSYNRDAPHIGIGPVSPFYFLFKYERKNLKVIGHFEGLEH